MWTCLTHKEEERYACCTIILCWWSSRRVSRWPCSCLPWAMQRAGPPSWSPPVAGSRTATWASPRRCGQNHCCTTPLYAKAWPLCAPHWALPPHPQRMPVKWLLLFGCYVIGQSKMGTNEEDSYNWEDRVQRRKKDLRRRRRRRKEEATCVEAVSSPSILWARYVLIGGQLFAPQTTDTHTHTHTHGFIQ